MGEYVDYNDDVQLIKEAILHSQYRAEAGSNAVQLGLYYGVGRYVSSRVQSGAWGESSLKAVSAQLRKELPGLRGFFERNLHYVKTIYEEWSPFLGAGSNSAVAIAELPGDEILQLQLQRAEGFPSEAFLTIGLTLHSQILTSAKNYDERIFYIRRCAGTTVLPEDCSATNVDRLQKAGASDLHVFNPDAVLDTTGRFTTEDGNAYEYAGHWSWIYFFNNAAVDADGLGAWDFIAQNAQ